MQAAIEKEFDLLSDFEVREEARRSREHYEYLAGLNEELKEKDSVIEQKQAELKEKDLIISELQKELSKYKKD